MSKLVNVNDDDLEVYMDYLYSLRRSGVTNMFGATPYLQNEFDLNKQTAKKVLVYWMENFDEEKA